MSDLGELTRPGSGAPPGAPAGRRTRTSLWRLPPWTRAPLLGLLSPGAVVAVLVTSAILACAVASAPLFLSSARSAALQQQLAPPACAEASDPTVVGRFATLPGAQPADIAGSADTYRRAFAADGLTSTRELLVGRSIGVSGNPQFSMPVTDPSGVLLTLPANLLWRPGATGHVHAVESGGGAGVWLPKSYADTAHTHPGDRITMAGAPVTVVGVYTDLYDTVPGAYWCADGPLFLNLASSDTAPPPWCWRPTRPPSSSWRRPPASST